MPGKALLVMPRCWLGPCWGSHPRTWPGTTSWRPPWSPCAGSQLGTCTCGGGRRGNQRAQGRRRSPFHKYQWKDHTWYQPENSSSISRIIRSGKGTWQYHLERHSNRACKFDTNEQKYLKTMLFVIIICNSCHTKKSTYMTVMNIWPVKQCPEISNATETRNSKMSMSWLHFQKKSMKSLIISFNSMKCWPWPDQN